MCRNFIDNDKADENFNKPKNTNYKKNRSASETKLLNNLLCIKFGIGIWPDKKN